MKRFTAWLALAAVSISGALAAIILPPIVLAAPWVLPILFVLAIPFGTIWWATLGWAGFTILFT